MHIPPEWRLGRARTSWGIGMGTNSAAVQPAPPARPGRRATVEQLGVAELEIDRSCAEGGMRPAQVSAKPYWRVGWANAEHGEPPRDR
jgi:hypothetical protein